MDNDDIQKKKTPDTAEYSATKAPENKEHVESRSPSGDPRLLPGGAHGAKAAVGISELDHDQVPSGASDLDLIDFGEEPATSLTDDK
jgi:hypothetical protein